MPVADPSSTVEPVAGAAESDAALRFRVQDGALDNHFYRDGDVAAHLVTRSGERPRILAAFPAGNTGIGLWLTADAATRLTVEGELAPTTRDRLRGVTASLTIDAPADTPIVVDDFALGSVRVLRDVNAGHPVPDGMGTASEATATTFRVHRTSLSGQHHYQLWLEAEGGTSFADTEDGAVRIVPPSSGTAARLRATFLHDHEALTPISLDRLLTAAAAPLEDERKVLAFLAYEEKLLAGSWRFLTYFGRDTLLSTRLLLPALQPVAIEGALGSVLDRLSPGGEVAHEEDIGDFAAWRHLEAGEPPSEDPVFDYKMVDDDFMLAPLLASHFVDSEVGPDRLAAFTARTTPGARSYRDAVAANLDFVVRAAAPFADEPIASNLIPIRGKTGDWRDSNEGLGGGRYSYSVNAVLVPAALRAAARLHALEPWRDEEKAKQAERIAQAWDGARDLFRVELPPARASKRATAAARRLGLDAAPFAKLEAPLVFWAVALDDAGEPIAVENSDVGFELLFGEPGPAELGHIARLIESPYPLGLHTPLGVVVASGTYLADRKLAATFGPESYHGAVVWSWQQALLAAGLERQLGRSDVPAATREKLRSAQAALWQVIEANRAQRASEYWSWKIVDGAFALHRPGQGQDHESNAAQLWSTVFIAVKPPR